MNKESAPDPESQARKYTDTFSEMSVEGLGQEIAILEELERQARRALEKGGLTLEQ